VNIICDLSYQYLSYQGKPVTISAKIPQKLKDELKRQHIKTSDAIRKGLEKELKNAKIRELQSMLKEIDFSKVSDEPIVRDARETRRQDRNCVRSERIW
jgi:hypothetical protein